ncbi:MAG: protein-glutamate O-methyltransferase CheR [Desulfobulbaceae bacterium]|nr:protein-glutamate O-methyltransferase CheR [Desulfobulbaceae bacterium]
MNKETFSTKDFRNLATFIQDNYGIKMPDSKQVMLESRLRRRMRQAGYSSIRDYLDYVFSPEGRCNELVHMVDTVTTNKTDFFREPVHFTILCDRIIPRITAGRNFSGSAKLRVWSSACSTGEEPYTLAMVLHEFAEKNCSLRYSILASDLSTRVLKIAHRGVYNEDQIKEIPLRLREKYLLRSKNRALGLVQIREHLRESVTFRRINLMDDDFNIREKMHIIFCRNVLIYFEKNEQERLMHRFADLLEPGGFLFIGHSESLAGMEVPFVSVAQTIYQKK